MSRPQVSVKFATSLDGKIALSDGTSKWITSEQSRAYGRQLRSEHDAIAIGSNTALMDDPMLTTRVGGLKNPIRVIYDSQLRMPAHSKLASTTAEAAVWVFCHHSAKTSVQASNLQAKGVEVIGIDGAENGLDILQSLKNMQVRGIESLLIEGGGRLAASFLKAGLVDKVYWFRAPILLGSDSLDCVAPLGLTKLENAPKFKRVDLRSLGNDILEIYKR